MKRLVQGWSHLSIFTRWLLILFALNGVLLNALLTKLPWNPGYTAAFNALYFIKGNAAADSWSPMDNALDHIHKSPDTPIYKEMFFNKGTKFQYLPSSLLILEMAQKLSAIASNRIIWQSVISWFSVIAIGGLATVLLYFGAWYKKHSGSFPTSKSDVLACFVVIMLITLTYFLLTRHFILTQTWKFPGIASNSFIWLNVISWFSVMGIGGLSLVLLHCGARYTRDSGLDSSSIIDVVARLVVIMLIALTFYPLTTSFILGQIQTWLTLLGAASLLAWECGSKKTAGLFIGLACIVKPHWSAVLLWAFIRKQWGMATTCLITIVALVSLSIYSFGIHHYPDYMNMLSFLSRHGESYFSNQSVNGLVNRMLFIGNNLNWIGNSFPPFNPIVYTATVVSSVLLLGVALFWKWRNPTGSGTIELAIIILSLTIASPIAWVHHYAILLPIFAYIAPIVFYRRRARKGIITCLIIAFVLASNKLGIANLLAATPLNFLQSYLFFAGLLTLYILYQLSWKESGKVVNYTMKDYQNGKDKKYILLSIFSLIFVSFITYKV